ncbi:MAG: ABC transporter permease [Candidatus Stahlbacteria bacterium]|nr:ABC transporter permease [Candidatus Stahlbacteria bacterium]
MRVEFFIACRHLISSGGAFRKIISTISIGGVVIGVSSLLIVTSVENGFHISLKEKILATNPDVVVLKFHRALISDYEALVARISKIPNVRSAKPYVYSKGMLKTDESQDGVILRGVASASEIENLDGNLGGSASNGIVLGKYLSDRLGVFLYDTVTLYSIGDEKAFTIKSSKFVVSGIFDAGLYEYTNSLAYLSLSGIQKFLGLGDRVTGIEIRLSDIYKAPEVAETINKDLGYPYYATHWIELNTNLFSALKLEKITMFILLLLIIIVACFGISATLIMLITQKTREIGILRSMGATSYMVMRIFMLEGLLIGAIGSGIGTIIGYVVCNLLRKYQFIQLPPGVYGIDTLPVYMKVGDFLLVGLGAILIAFLSSLYPAVKASKLLPSEAIRYE